jgi:hypothetical protein
MREGEPFQDVQAGLGGKSIQEEKGYLSFERGNSTSEWGVKEIIG